MMEWVNREVYFTHILKIKQDDLVELAWLLAIIHPQLSSADEVLLHGRHHGRTEFSHKE
jgi:hypothetical protein